MPLCKVILYPNKIALRKPLSLNPFPERRKGLLLAQSFPIHILLSIDKFRQVVHILEPIIWQVVFQPPKPQINEPKQLPKRKVCQSLNWCFRIKD